VLTRTKFQQSNFYQDLQKGNTTTRIDPNKSSRPRIGDGDRTQALADVEGLSESFLGGVSVPIWAIWIQKLRERGEATSDTVLNRTKKGDRRKDMEKGARHARI
jgi:hypothetical protein